MNFPQLGKPDIKHPIWNTLTVNELVFDVAQLITVTSKIYDATPMKGYLRDAGKSGFVDGIETKLKELFPQFEGTTNANYVAEQINDGVNEDLFHEIRGAYTQSQSAAMRVFASYLDNKLSKGNKRNPNQQNI